MITILPLAANFCNIHVSLVPVVGAVGEQKSKPTQASVRELRALGLSPDLIVCRSNNPVSLEMRAKIASFCNVPPSHVISVHDMSNLYRVPLLLQSQGAPLLLLLPLPPLSHPLPPSPTPLITSYCVYRSSCHPSRVSLCFIVCDVYGRCTE